MQPFTAVRTREGVVLPSESEADSLHQDGYGRWDKKHRLVLHPVEVLYNIERSKIAVVDEETNTTLTFRDLLETMTRENRDTWIHYTVYRDMRTRGFVLFPNMNGFKVYERGTYRKQPASYQIHVIAEGSPEKISELTEALSKESDSGLEMKLAVVDRRGDIVYYGVKKRSFTA